MEKYIINGGKKLSGETIVSGSKNVALKALVAACLTSEKVTIHNVPLISDLYIMIEIIKELGGKASLIDHSVTVQIEKITKNEISLDRAAEVRTSSMFISPLLARVKEAKIPNPGGCRLGARPIDRTIEGIRCLGAKIIYKSEDGYFHATANEMHGATYTFEKNTHTGTETLLLSAVLATGTTILENAAAEPEVDELITLLCDMGADIKRIKPRTIEINGVKNLHGATYTVKPDRNEIITLASAALITEGDVLIYDAEEAVLKDFLLKLKEANAGYEIKEKGIRFFYKGPLQKADVLTLPYPGFMTDWQGPWAVLMTKANGTSVIHETVFENRFGYVSELKKMGAKISLFNPQVPDSRSFYNFNIDDDKPEFFHAAKVIGPTTLHNAVVTISDIRAGATLVLAALAAHGESTIFGIEKLNRGYEQLDVRLQKLGAEIERGKD